MNSIDPSIIIRATYVTPHQREVVNTSQVVNNKNLPQLDTSTSGKASSDTRTHVHPVSRMMVETRAVNATWSKILLGLFLEKQNSTFSTLLSVLWLLWPEKIRILRTIRLNVTLFPTVAIPYCWFQSSGWRWSLRRQLATDVLAVHSGCVTFWVKVVSKIPDICFVDSIVQRSDVIFLQEHAKLWSKRCYELVKYDVRL